MGLLRKHQHVKKIGISVETGCKTIFRFDNVLEDEICQKICDYIIPLKKSKSKDKKLTMPWHDKNSFQWTSISDADLKRSINEYRQILTKIVNEVYVGNNKKYFIEHTDLVLWDKNKSMPRHIDDDINGKFPHLKHRKITTVTYLNDDFEGGETFIGNETGIDYISKPKRGSVIIFLSDDTNAHGVNTVLSGMRMTLPVWFCDDEIHSEKLLNFSP